MGSLRERLTAIGKDFSDWRYERDITKRRVKYYAKWIGFGILIIIAYSIPILLGLSLTQILTPITAGLRALIGVLYSLAGVLQMPDPTGFVTQIVANAVAVFGIGVMNVIILRRLIKQRDPPEPDLVIRHGYAISTKDKAQVFTATIHNKGDTAALSCQARITFDGLDRRDILEIPNVKSHINSETFDYIVLNRSTLPWVSFPPFSSPKDFLLAENMSIIAGDDAQLGIVRIVPAESDIPEHFEILSALKGEAIACLRMKRLYGKITVTPQNGEPETRGFHITPYAFTSDWHLSLE